MNIARYKQLNQVSLEQAKKKINELEQTLRQSENLSDFDKDTLFNRIVLHGIMLFTLKKANDMLDNDNNLVVKERSIEDIDETRACIDKLLETMPQMLSDQDLKNISLFSVLLVGNAMMLRDRAEMDADYYRLSGLKCVYAFVVGLCLGVLVTAILAPLGGLGVFPLALFGIIVGSIFGGALLYLPVGFILDLFKTPYLKEMMRLEKSLLPLSEGNIRRLDLINSVNASCPALKTNSIFQNKIYPSLKATSYDSTVVYSMMSLKNL